MSNVVAIPLLYVCSDSVIFCQILEKSYITLLRRNLEKGKLLFVYVNRIEAWAVGAIIVGIRFKIENFD